MHPAGMGFDFIMIVALLPSHFGFFFIFGCGLSFFGRFQHPPFDGCPTTSCDFGALTGGDEHVYFLSAVWNWKHCLSILIELFLFPSALYSSLFI